MRQDSKNISSSNLIEFLSNNGYERVIHYSDPKHDLKVIVAVHDTTLGPALGGARLWNYRSEEEALKDVLRLSEGMTYKSSLAGLNLGGGKAVIFGKAHHLKTETFLRAYGRFIDSLNGIYITAADVNTTSHDMEVISRETKHVVSLPSEAGGSGDPSIMTAKGVYQGIKASLNKTYGVSDLANKSIAIQGLGKVGGYIARWAKDDGANVIVADISQERIKEITDSYNVTVVSPDDILSQEVDVLCPCALGGIINDNTIESLRCKIIAGGANNQLEDIDKHDQMLFDKGIFYTPDFAVNSGGVINAYAEHLGNYDKARAESLIENIYNTISDIYDDSSQNSIPTFQIALRHAKERIAIARSQKGN